MTAPILVFDLDGTLVDTAPDLLDSLNHCLALEGMAPANPRRLSVLCWPRVARYDRARLRGAPECRWTTERLDRLQAVFLEHYVGSMPGSSALYPGVERVLDQFASDGFLLAVCTNKFEGMSVRLLNALGLSAQVCGGLRRRHICLAQTRPAPSVRHDQQGWRRSVPRRHVRRFARRH